MATTVGFKIILAPIGPFNGTSAELAQKIADNLSVNFEQDFTSIEAGSTEPVNTQSPWYKDYQTWYFYDTNKGLWQPINLEAQSLRYVISATQPSASEYLVWIKTATDGKPESVNIFYNNAWMSVYYTKTEVDGFFEGYSDEGKAKVSYENVVGIPDFMAFFNLPDAPIKRGTTAQRPTGLADGYLYYDTDIGIPIVSDQATTGGWKTLAGCKGDIKACNHPSIDEALRHNPGWQIYNIGNMEGRTLVGAGGSWPDGSSRGVLSDFGTPTTTLVAQNLPPLNIPTKRRPFTFRVDEDTQNNQWNIFDPDSNVTGSPWAIITLTEKPLVIQPSGSSQPFSAYQPSRAVIMLFKAT